MTITWMRNDEGVTIDDSNRRWWNRRIQDIECLSRELTGFANKVFMWGKGSIRDRTEGVTP